MSSIVVGGQGFIGAEIVRALLARGEHVTLIDKAINFEKCDQLFGSSSICIEQGDILDAVAMRELTRGAETVYHLAGELGTSELDENIVSAIQTNIIGATNVFSACQKNGVRTVFHASKPNVWLNTYTITKYAAEQFAALFNTMSGTRICTLRYFNAYGPHQATGPIRKIIPAFAFRAITGRPIEIYGSGEQVVDMIFVEDIGRITVDFVKRSRSESIHDLGRGIGLTVNSIAKAVNSYFGNRSDIVHLPMRRGEIPETKLVANIESLEREIGPLSFADWVDSLNRTLQWYADHFLDRKAT